MHQQERLTWRHQKLLKKVKELKELNEKEPRMTNGAENQSCDPTGCCLLMVCFGFVCTQDAWEDLSMTMALPSITSFVTFILPGDPKQSVLFNANAKHRSKGNTKQTGRTGEARGRCDIDWSGAKMIQRHEGAVPCWPRRHIAVNTFTITPEMKQCKGQIDWQKKVRVMKYDELCSVDSWIYMIYILTAPWV